MSSQDKIDSYFFSKINKKIVSVCKKIEDIKGIAPEIVIIIIWSAVHFVVSAFHERWFDEAVAWQIAKNASLHDLFFSVPHYEGHVPLWHLILRPFAKLGAPYSLSLTIVTFLFMGAAIYLVLFKTSLPRVIRLTIPFTYFALYQFGVIGRPYCIVALVFVMLGILHKTRNTSPAKYTLCVFLLCLTCAYGILLAFGICLVWLWEIFCDCDKKIGRMFKDKRIACLVVLAIAVVEEGLMLLPAEDRYASFTASGKVGTAEMVKCVLYLFLILPADALFTDTISEYALMPYYNFATTAFITGLVIGIIVLFIIITTGIKKGTLGYIIVPHLLFAGFSSVVYFSVHHMGIWTFLFMFWLIITFDSEKNKDFSLHDTLLPVYNSVGACVILIVIAISMFQGISSCITDMKESYSADKAIAEYLTEHDLRQYKVMATWDEDYEEGTEGTENPVVKRMIPDLNNSDEINAYLGYNIFYNVYGGDDNAYIHHNVVTLDEARKIADEWKAQGYPDVIVGYPDLEFVFGEKKLLENEYYLVFYADYNQIWKGFVTNPGKTSIFMKKELADELGIKKLNSIYFGM